MSVDARALAGFYQPAGLIERAVFIGEDPRFVFFSIPKCGCSTMKYSLSRAFPSDAWDGHEGRQRPIPMPAVHDRSATSLRSPGQVGIPKFLALLDDAQVVKFTVVREPIERLCSAYADKILRSPAFRLRFIRKCAASGIRVSDVPTFSEFLDGLSRSEAVRMMDPHWRPQTRLVPLDLVPGIALCRLDRLEDDLEPVVARIGMQTRFRLIDVRTVHPANRSSSATVLSGLTPADRDLIGSVYAEDVAMYASAHR